MLRQARDAQVPKDIIERNIKKASEANQADFQELLFEAYGPGGTGFLIECLSDNNNRSASEVRSAVTKSGGKMAEQGSVAFNFKRQGVVMLQGGALTEEQVHTTLGDVHDMRFFTCLFGGAARTCCAPTSPWCCILIWTAIADIFDMRVTPSFLYCQFINLHQQHTCCSIPLLLLSISSTIVSTNNTHAALPRCYNYQYPAPSSPPPTTHMLLYPIATHKQHYRLQQQQHTCCSTPLSSLGCCMYPQNAGPLHLQVYDAAMEAGADDVQAVEDEDPPAFRLLSSVEDFASVRDAASGLSLPVNTERSGLIYTPLVVAEVDDETLETNSAMLERILALDDVDAVYTTCAGLQ